MDFYQIRIKELKDGRLEIYPDFVVGRTKDLMVRGGSFYAIWDDKIGMWSTDEYDVRRLVDEELLEIALGYSKETTIVKTMQSYSSNSWASFRRYIGHLSDNSHQLDEKLSFANSELKRTDYASKRLPYSLIEGDISAWDELVGTLYNPDEREKIEWAIGAVISGDAAKIHKFLVLYGPTGTGKSTILNIIEKLFVGYTSSFDAKALGSNNNSFSTEAFRFNPLVAIQHDGDLSRIEDNTKLNSIVAHEAMMMNEKYKSTYTSKVNAMLFMGTNQPVKISDAKSGIIRRLIDINPSGAKLAPNHYNSLMMKIDFELGAIAYHCLNVYRSYGMNRYNNYQPIEMMFQTDPFFNFVEAHFDIFKSQESTTMKQAYNLYKEFCSSNGLERQLPMHRFRSELRNYFDTFEERARIDGIEHSSVYSGFKINKFKASISQNKEPVYSLVMGEMSSLLDRILGEQPAQLAKVDETPEKRWTYVKTTLKDIDTSQIHYVKVPENHIVIDFDLKDEEGNKSLELNLKSASEWPDTYAELSKGGAGVHLHYIYEGDVHKLRSDFSNGIEVKTLLGDASLRRRLSKCNNVPVASISTGLPLKEENMLQTTTMQSEKGLRDLIARNLRKEIHAGTKPSIDFIQKILQDAYDSNMVYDVTDLRPNIMAFANNSTNQPLLSLKVVQKMKFASESQEIAYVKTKDDRRTFFDVEVYPNLFVLCWKFEGDANIVKMINPKAKDVEALFVLKLVGFNNRRYDNHIIYAASMGYTNKALYELSQELVVENNRNAPFGAAYNLSYEDVWDVCSEKKSLKQWEIELGIFHLELDLPWDQPVPEEMFEVVADYCGNDVIATEKVAKAREQDFVARHILAELSGLSVNDTTQRHTARIIFGNNQNANKEFVYTDLREQFPGYEFERGVSTYQDEPVGEGGYVYSEPGMYEKVSVWDIESMHPNSIRIMNMFGPYTKNFVGLLEARTAIKRGEFDSARKMLDGKLVPYLTSNEQAEALSYALKIVINIVYGLTSAKFPNPFRDSRNIDNICAKRGALFMIDLKKAVQERGFTVAHIKTDSIKIPDATPDIADFIVKFGEKYGYKFVNEGVYDKFCLVNDAVFIARKDIWEQTPGKQEAFLKTKWDAVGAQFQHSYVYKTLFSHEPIEFKDICEPKSVKQGAMYLDFEAREKPMALASGTMRHVGKTGLFVPVLEGGAILYRVKDDTFFAVSGTKNHFWIEAEMAIVKDDLQVDESYFHRLVNEARNAIDKFGSFEYFVS